MSRRDASKPIRDELRATFTPESAIALREGYGAARFKADALAGLTVAIVALPLSMAIAIASGLPPERGLYAAIVGGFIVSLLGGCRHQIGGPAGAFIVLVAAIVERHGVDGLLLASMLAGLILIAVGLLRLGSYIRFIPHAVTIGFTAGIAVIIAASQLRDFLGLPAQAEGSAELSSIIQHVAASYEAVTPSAVALGLGVILLIVGLKRLRPAAPGMLVAIVVASLLTAGLDLPVETIGARYGAPPGFLPAPVMPEISLERVIAVLPDAFALALLGGVESLLSAVVADGMSGRRHRSDVELVAQGVANCATASFGGVFVTGTIARTATNIRAGATSPAAGMLHSVFLLAFMAAAAPLAAHIPLAALAGVLLLVAWNMAERHEFLRLLTASRADAAVLCATFLLTIFVDLLTGIAVGVVLGALVFMHRMADLVSVAPAPPSPVPAGGEERPDADVMVYRVSGPLFFAASSTIASALERIGDFPEIVVIDLSGAPFADASGAASLSDFVSRAAAHGAEVRIVGATPAVRRSLKKAGLKPPRVAFAASTAAARPAARSEISRT